MRILFFSLIYLFMGLSPAVASQCIEYLGQPPRVVRPIDVAVAYKKEFRASYVRLAEAFNHTSNNVLTFIHARENGEPIAMIYNGKIAFIKILEARERLKTSLSLLAIESDYAPSTALTLDSLKLPRDIYVSSRVFYNEKALIENPLYKLVQEANDPHRPPVPLRPNQWNDLFREFIRSSDQIHIKVPVGIVPVEPTRTRLWMSRMISLLGGLASIVMGHVVYGVDLNLTQGFFFYEIALPSMAYGLIGGTSTYLTTRYVLKFPENWWRGMMDRRWLKQTDPDFL